MYEYVCAPAYSTLTHPGHLEAVITSQHHCCTSYTCCCRRAGAKTAPSNLGEVPGLGFVTMRKCANLTVQINKRALHTSTLFTAINTCL